MTKKFIKIANQKMKLLLPIICKNRQDFKLQFKNLKTIKFED